MCVKSKLLLRYILKDAADKGVTSLMKLSYLIDLVAVRELGHQLSSFKYIRFNYGPFDARIYKDLEDLQKNEFISSYTDYATQGYGEQVVFYKSNEESIVDDEFTNEEKIIIQKVLNEFKAYGAKPLTEIAYKTDPMRKFNATLGGNEHLGELLELSYIMPRP